MEKRKEKECKHYVKVPFETVHNIELRGDDFEIIRKALRKYENHEREVIFQMPSGRGREERRLKFQAMCNVLEKIERILHLKKSDFDRYERGAPQSRITLYPTP